MYVKGGVLDGAAADGLKPVADIFTRSRLPWVKAIEGANQQTEMM